MRFYLELVLFHQLHGMEEGGGNRFFPKQRLRMRDCRPQRGNAQNAAPLALLLRSLNRPLHQKIGISIAEGGNFHHGHAHALFQQLRVYPFAALFQNVRHVQSHDKRDIQLHQLRGEVEIALEIGRIDDVDDAVGTFVEDKIPRDHLLGRIGRKGINPGQIDDIDGLRSLFIDSLPLIDGDAGPVSHVCAAARQSVE